MLLANTHTQDSPTYNYLTPLLSAPAFIMLENLGFLQQIHPFFL